VRQGHRPAWRKSQQLLGKLPVEKTGAQEMILRHQEINGASVLRGWLMDWLKNSSRSKKGEQKVSA
jgi:predicted DNA-binding ribbon-helix-helix protein